MESKTIYKVTEEEMLLCEIFKKKKPENHYLIDEKDYLFLKKKIKKKLVDLIVNKPL